MIFAIAGSQLPYPRMMDALSAIAAETGLKIFAQTADPAFTSPHLEHAAFLSPTDFDRRFAEAELIVSHAGIGVLISAGTHRKPLIVMPRRASLGEHRNEHQLATAARFADRPGLTIANTRDELVAAIAAPPQPMGEMSSPLSAQLFDAIRAELRGQPVSARSLT